MASTYSKMTTIIETTDDNSEQHFGHGPRGSGPGGRTKFWSQESSEERDVQRSLFRASHLRTRMSNPERHSIAKHNARQRIAVDPRPQEQ